MARAKDKAELFFGLANTMTDEQWAYAELIALPPEQVRAIIIDAKAGTGKTQIAVAGAKLRGTKLRYIFAPVNEEEQGYLPGDQIDKDKPYLGALHQSLTKIGETPSRAIVDPRVNDFMNANAWVYAHSHTFERGKTYEDETVIIDEAQNFTKPQLRKILTRCADSCKVILIGNMKQCDLNDPSSQSGFEEYSYHLLQKPWAKRAYLNTNFRGELAQWADEI